MTAQVADLRPTIVAKSDQLNADDLIGGPMTITVTGVRLMGDEQPVAIDWEGGAGRPFKPCKTMRRLIVEAWGPDGNAYAGRSMTVYRDPKVKFGGDQVGGIRISHMSHIERDLIVALTVTRGKRAPYTVKPLQQAQRKPRDPALDGLGLKTGSDIAKERAPGKKLADRVQGFKNACNSPNATTAALTEAWDRAAQLRSDLEAHDPEGGAELNDWFNARFAEVEDAEKGGQF